MFVDGGGQDDYARIPEGDEGAPAPIGNDRAWGLADRDPGKKPGAKGGGVDAASGELGLP